MDPKISGRHNNTKIKDEQVGTMFSAGNLEDVEKEANKVDSNWDPD